MTPNTARFSIKSAGPFPRNPKPTPFWSSADLAPVDRKQTVRFCLRLMECRSEGSTSLKVVKLLELY